MTLRLKLLALLVIILGAFSLSGQEDELMCAPAQAPNVHECHCAHMVSDVQEEYLEACDQKPTKAERDDCVASLPHTCDIVDNPGAYGAYDHPDKCKTACKKNKCQCNEGACLRPAAKKGKR